MNVQNILSRVWSDYTRIRGLDFGFIELLQIRDYKVRIKTVPLIHALYSSLEHTLKSSEPAVSSPVSW
jgi:hypothetical protein